MTTSPLVLAVNPATGIRSVADLIAAAKKDPGKLNYSTSGNGSAPHLGAALFSQLTGAQMTHIPYKGGAPAIQSVMAGDTQLTFGTSPSVLPQVNGRQAARARRQHARALAAGAGPARHEGGRVARIQPRVLVRHVRARRHAARRSSRRSTTRPSPRCSSRRSRRRWRARAPRFRCPRRPSSSARFLVEDGKFWVNLVKSANVKIE